MAACKLYLSDRKFVVGLRKAMAAVSVVITGSKKVNRRLKALVPKVQKQVARKAARSVAKLVAQESKEIVRSRTGGARRSFKVRAIKRSRFRIGSQVVAGSDSRGGDAPFYLKFLELGKEGQPALKFLRGTLYNRTNRWRLVFEKEMRRFIAAA